MPACIAAKVITMWCTFFLPLQYVRVSTHALAIIAGGIYLYFEVYILCGVSMWVWMFGCFPLFFLRGGGGKQSIRRDVLLDGMIGGIFKPGLIRLTLTLSLALTLTLTGTSSKHRYVSLFTSDSHAQKASLTCWVFCWFTYDIIQAITEYNSIVFLCNFFFCSYNAIRTKNMPIISFVQKQKQKIK